MEQSEYGESSMQTCRLKSAGSELEVDWGDARSTIFYAIWLRDSCRCDQCGDPVIGRRSLRLTDLDLSISLTAAEISLSGGQAVVHVEWSDGHQGSFDSQWLLQHCYEIRTVATQHEKLLLWDDAYLKEPTKFSEQDIAGDSGLLKLLESIESRGFAFLTGGRTKSGILEALASRIGFIQESNFGRVQNLVLDNEKRSIANDVTELKPHTDEPYRSSPPGILLFHCIETDVEGAGHSTFLDGFEIAHALRCEDPQAFDTLVKYPLRFRRFFEGDVDAIAEFPVISLDQDRRICGVRINDRVAGPPRVACEDMPMYYRGMQRLLELSEDPSRILKIKLMPGDIAIFDNHRVLHGRTRLTMLGRRWLQWVQIERGDFYSTKRIVSDRLGKARSDGPGIKGAYS